MEFLVSYDINTETPEGERRLRQVAKICEGFGQRVLKSVFECVLDRAGFEELVASINDVIVPSEDSVRIYRLREPRDRYLWRLGRDLDFDIHRPLIV